MRAESKSVTVVITCATQSGKVEMATGELEAAIWTVMANEPACPGIRMHDDPKKQQHLLLIEHWDSEEIFSGAHMHNPFRQTFFKSAQDFLDGPAAFGFALNHSSAAESLFNVVANMFQSPKFRSPQWNPVP